MLSTWMEGFFADPLSYVLIRAACAAVVALLLVLGIIPLLAGLARRRRFCDQEGKTHSDTLNALHAQKKHTPIVGGIAILIGTFAASLLFTDLGSSHVWLLLVTLLGLGALGFVDDYAKTFGAVRTRGLTARQKLAGQVALGLGVAVFLLGRAWHDPSALQDLTALHVPFLGISLTIGTVGFLLLGVFLVTGSSNAVNLTDGLDGLAGGCALVAFGVFLAVAVVVGDPRLAHGFGLPHLPGAGEVAVVLGGLAGGLIAFLVFNRHPARVFMGDTGSLPIGGALAVAALLTKQELLLAVVGGVFVAEALSVMLQVASYKLTGKRVFRCAPLHHHFEFKGWREALVVNRFHAAALFLGLLGLAGLGS